MAKQYRLSRDVTIRFRDSYDVRAKAGTILEHVPYNAGLATPGFAIPVAACETDVGQYAAFDLAHYYVWAPADAVEEIDTDAPDSAPAVRNDR